LWPWCTRDKCISSIFFSFSAADNTAKCNSNLSSDDQNWEQLVNMEKLVKFTAIIYVTWNSTLFLFYSSPSALTSFRAPKPHFAKQFWIIKGTMDSYNRATLCMATKMLHFIISAAGTFLPIACNEGHTRCIWYLQFIKCLIPGQAVACDSWWGSAAGNTTGAHAAD
jgi:hypothetical protein